MAKQKKTAFGVSEDGLNLKMACLVRDGHMISLQSLEQIELNEPLYQHVGDETLAPDQKLDDWMTDNNPTSEISFNDFASDGSAFKTQPYEVMFQTYPMDKGMIALNVNDDQLIKVPVSGRNISSQQKKKLIRESIPRTELKDGNWQSSVVSINDQSELWIHHGTNRLLEIMQNSQATHKARYFFQLAESIEVALANLFTTNKSYEANEKSMVLYLGNENKRALVFEGNKWTFSLPIHITQQQPDIDMIYSKLSLAMDEAHIADPENLYICGENSYLETVEYLRKQLPNTKVEIWQLDNIYLDSEITQVYDSDMIARFILPIALAWKALNLDNSDTMKTNFLPSSVIEGQKVFKIAWHGYLVFALLFLAALFLTLYVNQLNYDIRLEEGLNKRLTVEYNDKKQQAEAMLEMSKAIEKQAANIELIKSVLENKNPWTEIITRLNNSFRTHPTSWIKTIKKDGTGFRMTGVTTYRPNIVYFSNLFDNGSIISARYRKIRSFTVWDFDIKYDYPTVDWYKMMEADAEQLRKYQEAKRATTLKDLDANNKSGQSLISRTTEQIKDSVTKLDDEVDVTNALIDIPVPAKKLTAKENDPAVIEFKKIVTAFNSKNDWLLIDLGMKFVKSYPSSPLKPYVQWYNGYRGWADKQYNKVPLWNDPIMRIQGPVYPYALLLSSVTARDRGNKSYAVKLWKRLESEYPQHPVGKTAKKLLNE